MGRNTILKENPSVKTFKWKNEKFDKKTKTVTRETGWYYWDKTIGENGEEVRLEDDLRFIWLESMQSVSGFSKKEEIGIYSNEVPGTPDGLKEYGKQELVVKIGTNIIAKGSWKEISEEVKGHGGKYTLAVYGNIMNKNGEWEIVRFLFSGSSREPWMKISDRQKLLNNAVIISNEYEEVEMKTGETYQSPILQLASLTNEEKEEADKSYPKVKDFFNFQFNENLEHKKEKYEEIEEEIPDPEY